MYSALRTGSVEAAVFVGGSNATHLSYAASTLGLDVYKHTKGGWKLTKENVDNLLPDLKDTLGSVPPDTPVVLFCLDNSCFMGLNEDGSMTRYQNVSKGTTDTMSRGHSLSHLTGLSARLLNRKKELLKRAATTLYS
jgi:hypothetical protein